MEGTYDYEFSLAAARCSVDSSPGSFCPVLPAPRQTRFFGTEVPWVSDALYDGLLHFLDFGFIALVKRPLFDALGAHQPGLQQDLHVFAGGGLAHAQFFGDQDAANAVVDQVPVDLGPEVLSRVLEPFEDLQAAVVGQGAQCRFHFHIDN